ncbi:chemotaxis protein [Bermanella sp. 47_1433_sub80_T6]|nr:chemotaxis protein [Bermanella sp. 47_1433_sub80_T6]
MRVLSLKTKLLVTLIVAFVLLTVVISANLYNSLTGMRQDLAQQASQTMEQEVLARLDSEAAKLGNQVGGLINGLFRIPLSLADTLIDSIQNTDHRLTRPQVNQLVVSSMAAHEDVSGIYAEFEPNGFDGVDGEYINLDTMHSVPADGVLEVYWYRNEHGKPEQEKSDDSTEKYNAELDEFGQRDAEYYLCSKDKGVSCTTEPYLYEINKDYSELMTSLVTPVMVAGEFRGIAGIDVNLSTLQKLTETLSKKLYNGQSKITLLSELGLIAASSHYSDKLTRPLKEARSTFDAKLINLHKQSNNVWINDGIYYLARGIHISASDSTWFLLIELPQEVVLATTNELINTIDDSVVSIVSQGVMIALTVTAGAIFLVVLLTRSIVSPIKKLDDMVQNLASSEGDLTQDIRLDTHAELISLSKGFNQFIHKLKAMVTELKYVGDAAKGSAIKGKAINQKSLQATREQQHEIDSVVTASNQMSASASEVSKVAEDVAHNAKTAKQTVLASQKTLAASVQTVQGLTADMNRASESISEVAERTEDINRILDVIRAIAEQTNLLALNAAIEAARAGEQGRGFAVVADEVRNLASKTQASTEEINQMIQGLKGGVDNAVSVIQSSTEKAQGAMGETQQSYDSLTNVVTDIGSIADHITQVATAAEQQSSVSEEISRNLTIIGDAAKALAELANENNEASDELENQMNTLDVQLSSLKT